MNHFDAFDEAVFPKPVPDCASPKQLAGSGKTGLLGDSPNGRLRDAVRRRRAR